jgi:hypothetical protein
MPSAFTLREFSVFHMQLRPDLPIVFKTVPRIIGVTRYQIAIKIIPVHQEHADPFANKVISKMQHPDQHK